MPQHGRPMRAWSSTPFAKGPRGGPTRKPRRRLPMGGMMPVHPPVQASEESMQLADAPVQPTVGIPDLAAAAPEAVRIVCTEGGPYLCYGATVETLTGGIEAPKDGKPLALCACGRSSTKPFCDGTHAKKEEPVQVELEIVAG